jgi:hypothetical protein
VTVRRCRADARPRRGRPQTVDDLERIESRQRETSDAGLEQRCKREQLRRTPPRRALVLADAERNLGRINLRSLVRPDTIRVAPTTPGAS